MDKAPVAWLYSSSVCKTLFCPGNPPKLTYVSSVMAPDIGVDTYLYTPFSAVALEVIIVFGSIGAVQFGYVPV